MDSKTWVWWLQLALNIATVVIYFLYIGENTLIDYWIPIDCLTTLSLFIFYYWHYKIDEAK